MSSALFWHLISLESRKLMSYRGDFWLTAIANLFAAILIHWFLWKSIFRTTGAEQIGGYSFEVLMTYLIAVNLIGRAIRGSDLQLAIATEIYDGSLSRYLLYPSRYLLFKYAQHLGSIIPEIFQTILFSAILIAAFGLSPEAGVTLSSIALAIPLIWIGNLLYFVMSVPLQLVSFWADNVWSLAVILRFVSMLLGGAMLPLSMFPDWAADALVWLPFVHCYELPVRVIMGRAGLEEALLGAVLGLGWCFAIALATAPVWRRGQLGYTGVGI